MFTAILRLCCIVSHQQPINWSPPAPILRLGSLWYSSAHYVCNYNMNFPNAVSLVRRKHTTKIPFSFWMRPLINSASRFVSHKLYHCNTRPTNTVDFTKVYPLDRSSPIFRKKRACLPQQCWLGHSRFTSLF